MEENQESQQHQPAENEPKSSSSECYCAENKKWIKYLLICLSAFLGAYLAVYYIVDQVRHEYYSPFMRFDNLDKVFREQEKAFDDFEKTTMNFNVEMLGKTPVDIETIKNDDVYKVIIDLKGFNNDEKNIKLDIKQDRLSISGESLKKDKNSQSEYSFSQNFSLPEKIDVNKVTKEKVDDKYVLTLPILNKKQEVDD